MAELAADWSGLVLATPGLAALEAPAPGVLVAAVSPLALGAVPVVLEGCEACALLMFEAELADSGVLGEALLALGEVAAAPLGLAAL